MTSRDFCFWLQGYLEIEGAADQGMATKSFGLTTAQTDCVRRHLALVFKHEIDPSMGDKNQQALLDKIHQAGYERPPKDPIIRC